MLPLFWYQPSQTVRVAFHRLRYSAWSWPVVVIFLVIVVLQSAREGIRLRDTIWQTTRSIRFHGDIANAFRWGGRVLRTARDLAGTDTPTFFDLVRAEGQLYHDLVEQSGTDDYQLDYPPARLLTASLWRRHVAESYPAQTDWPGQLVVGRRRPAGAATEDIASPLLAMNTACVAAAAVLAGALVALWVLRDAPRQRRETNDGVAAFMVCSAALIYALFVASWPSPAPPPSIVIDGPPTVSPGVDRRSTAIVRATINPQGAAARWFVQWGTLPGTYSGTTPQAGLDGATATAVTAELTNLPPGQTIYYRFVARNDSAGSAAQSPGRGVTRTDEAVFVADAVVQPAQPRETFNAVWLDAWQWSGIAVLFVGVCWSIRRMSPGHRAWASGLIAGALVWLNPALLVDTHAWPQWDAWLLPSFLGVALLASLDCWFAAGLLMGVGMMFKGQFLIGMPVLIIWPLAGGRVAGVARLLIGFALMAGVLLSPWIVLAGRPPSWNDPASEWIGGVLVAALLGVAPSAVRRRLYGVAAMIWSEVRAAGRPPVDSAVATAGFRPLIGLAGLVAMVAGAVVVVVLLVLRPWPVTAAVPRSIGWLLSGLLLGMPWVLPLRSLGVWLAAVLAAAVWLSSGLFDGDYSWKTVGFEYGTGKFDVIATGEGSNGNLPSILSKRFGWDLHDRAVDVRLPNLAALVYGDRPLDRVPRWITDWSLDGGTLTLDLKQTMILIYAALLIVCGLAAAGRSRRRDPRVLAAIVAPWVLMPNILCQMMCRYHIWGATLTALLVAVAPELALLNAVVATLAAGMVFNQLLNSDAGRSPQIHDLFTRLSPDSGWLMLSTAIIVFMLSLIPSPRRDRPLG